MAIVLVTQRTDFWCVCNTNNLPYYSHDQLRGPLRDGWLSLCVCVWGGVRKGSVIRQNLPWPKLETQTCDHLGSTERGGTASVSDVFSSVGVVFTSLPVSPEWRILMNSAAVQLEPIQPRLPCPAVPSLAPAADPFIETTERPT